MTTENTNSPWDKLKPAGPKDEIICILDRSGSMASIINDAIGGFNTFLQEQKEIEGSGANMTVVLFDYTCDPLYEQVDIQSIEPLNEKTYKPRGSTALLDAIGQTLNGFTPKDDGAKVIVVIVTDGEENTSQEWKLEQIHDLITECREERKWEFIFLAADQDAMRVGATMGLAGTAVNYASTSIGTTTAYATMTSSTTEFRTKKD